MAKAILSGFYVKQSGPARRMTLDATRDGHGNYHVMITRYRDDRGFTEFDGKADILLSTKDPAAARAAMEKVLSESTGWLHSKSLPGGRFR